MISVEAQGEKVPQAQLYLRHKDGTIYSVGMFKPDKPDAKYILSGKLKNGNEYLIFAWRPDSKSEKSPAVTFSVMKKEAQPPAAEHAPDSIPF